MLDLTFTPGGEYRFPVGSDALKNLSHELIARGYQEVEGENGLRFERGNKWAALYAVDIRKYKTVIRLRVDENTIRIRWHLYYNLLSFIGWRDLRVLNEEAAIMHRVFGVPYEYPKNNTAKVISLNPIYTFLTFVLLVLLVIDGYFLVKNNLHRFRVKPQWQTMSKAKKVCKNEGKRLLILYYRKGDPWTKYSMEDIFSGKKVIEFFKENKITPVRLEANESGVLPGGISPYLEIYDSKFKLKGRTNMLVEDDDLLDFLRHSLD